MSGTSSSPLDQAVKGAAPIGTSTAALLNSRPSTPKDSISNDGSFLSGSASDPAAALPSSPPQIYLNLLILEASLRSQYLTLRDRRRQNTFFILLLSVWIAYFTWALFLAPREDGSGIGGSVYWVVETGQKVALMAGVVTGILIWGTGQWERAVRWPRRFVGITNRGLRTMNCKLVVIKGPWWREMASHLAFLFPWTSYFFGGGPGESVDFRVADLGAMEKVRSSSKNGINFGEGLDYVRGEDLSSGGDHVKLLLLPRPFNPEFRENWELYRQEYWEKENWRRASIRQKIADLARARAREEGGWLWRLGWRGWRSRGHESSSGIVSSAGHKTLDVEKRHSRTTSEASRRRPSGRLGSESHPRNASSNRQQIGTDERPGSRGSRRGSIVAQDGRRRSARNSISGLQMNPIVAGSIGAGPAAGKRSSLAAPPLTRGDSFTPPDGYA